MLYIQVIISQFVSVFQIQYIRPHNSLHNFCIADAQKIQLQMKVFFLVTLSVLLCAQFYDKNPLL